MRGKKPTLFIFSGLPGSGKTVLSQMLAQQSKAIYLRIDTVEQGLRELCSIDVQGEGYRLAYLVAADNLKLGINVIADSCNPIHLTRREWEDVGRQAGANCINIEVKCSDIRQHRRRVENRKTTVAGLKLPRWEDVENREYHPWESERVIIDTAGGTPEQSFEELSQRLSQIYTAF